MNWDINECKNLTDKTKTLFFTSGMIYNPFQALCNWLYATKYSYSDRKRDSSREITVVILAEEHIDNIIEDRLIVAVNPEEYSEDVLKSMLEEFVGLKVWSN